MNIKSAIILNFGFNYFLLSTVLKNCREVWLEEAETYSSLGFFFYLPTTIPKAPNVRDFGLDQKSGGCSIPIGTTIVFVA